MFKHWIAKHAGVASRAYQNPFLTKKRVTVFVRLRCTSWANKRMGRMGVSGMTLGGLVLVRNNAWENRMSACCGAPFTHFEKHEMAHHWQCIRDGLIGHVLRYAGLWTWIYVAQWSKHPYYDHPAEMEARELAGQPQVAWREVGVNRWTPWIL